MIEDLVIVGCGGFGREVADVVEAINSVEPTWNLLGFVDEAPSNENISRVERRGSTVLGSIESVGGDAPHFVVGVGDVAARMRLCSLVEARGWIPATLAHPTAVLGANLELGPGSIICSHVAVGSDVRIGRHVHIDRATQVGHDCEVADFVTIHPAAVLSGNCQISFGVELGTNCTILPGVLIGEDAVVGAAACVTRNVLPHLRVRGVPAR